MRASFLKAAGAANLYNFIVALCPSCVNLPGWGKPPVSFVK